MIPCLECSSPVPQPSRRRREFCCDDHRRTFHNRRALRAAEICDLFRAIRRERKLAKRLDLWTEMCRTETLWEDEDRAAGRATKSYLEPERALKNLREVRDRVPKTNVGFLRPAHQTE